MAIDITAGVWSLLQKGNRVRSNSVAVDADLPVYSLLPDFRLLERSGRPFGLSDLRGKVWLANLFFSHCPDIGPLETAELAKLQTECAGEPDFRLVSISVNPERDTPQGLVRYADRNGADAKRWRFLTGHRETIYRLAREGFKLSLETPQPSVRVLGEAAIHHQTPSLAMPLQRDWGRAFGRVWKNLPPCAASRARLSS
jgi:cytochrome oxidase Cu insertion factor (SCO1/SenC/PrrC family)